MGSNMGTVNLWLESCSKCWELMLGVFTQKRSKWWKMKKEQCSVEFREEIRKAATVMKEVSRSKRR